MQLTSICKFCTSVSNFSFSVVQWRQAQSPPRAAEAGALSQQASAIAHCSFAGQGGHIFGSYFQFVILETNTYKEQRGLQFSRKTINNGPEKTYFLLCGIVEYSLCRTLLFSVMH